MTIKCMPGSNLAASIPFNCIGEMTFFGKKSSLYINEYFGIIAQETGGQYKYILINNPLNSYFTLDKLIYDNGYKEMVKKKYGNKG